MSALTEIQKKLKAPKSNYNSFGKYNYRSCEDILEAVKPLLGDNKLTLSDEVVQIGDRIYVKATAVFRDGARETRVSAFAREAESKKGMDESQVTGTASSYARKYALNGLFLIDDTKDADTDEFAKVQKKSEPKKEKQTDITMTKTLKQTEPVPEEPTPITPLQKVKLQNLMTEEQWQKTIEKNGDPDTWTSDQAEKWIEAILRRQNNAQ